MYRILKQQQRLYKPLCTRAIVPQLQSQSKRTMSLSKYFRNDPFFFGGFDEFAPLRSVRNDPFFDMMPVISNLQREADSMLVHSSPGFEINESDNRYQIAVDIPGVKASDVKVELEGDENQVLHISGGRKIEDKDSYREVKFDKRFTIGKNVDIDKLSANLADGVLVLSAPKVEVKKKEPRVISITEGASGDTTKKITEGTMDMEKE
jgi:HSP20 family protein